MRAQTYLSLLIPLLLLCTLPPGVQKVEGSSDPDPPRIENVNITGSETTGDPITISAQVVDGGEVSSAWLIHNWSVGRPLKTYNLSMMRAGDIFSQTIFNPINSTSSFWFRIKARDTSGNWNSTGWTSINITDNDIPIFISDNSSEKAYTGDAFTFAVNLNDNIGIFRASVNFSVDQKEYFYYSMCGAGNSRQTLVVLPLTAMGNLTYRFWFSDNEGNNDTTPWFSRKLFDNDPPVLMEDLTEGPPTTGEFLWMRFWVYDNWKTTDGWLTFTMGGWDYNFSFPSGARNNYTHGLYIPPTISGDLTYNATFIDGSGNRVTIDNRTMKILDNDPPNRWVDSSVNIATTGDDIEFQLEAFDNIGIESVEIHYLMPYEDWYISPMKRVGESSKFRYTLKAPFNLEDEIRYFFYMTDPSGNKNWSNVRSVHVFDNDAPEILFEETDENAETGEDFTFRIALKDNIGIGSVEAVYSYNEGSFEVELETSGPVSSGTLYEATIEIPSNAYGELKWEIIALDQRGNRANISGRVEIEDIVIPEIMEIRFWDVINKEFVTTLTTGDTFKMEVDVFDNIDAARVELALSLPGQDKINARMKRELKFGDIRTYSHEIIVPSSKLGRIAYIVVVFDHDNETSISDEGSIGIVDNDPPNVWNVSVPDSITVFEPIQIQLYAIDNIGVTSVRLERQNYFGVYEEVRLLDLVGDDLYSGTLHPTLQDLEDYEFRLVIEDGVNTVIQSYSIKVIDDVPPSVYIGGLIEGYGYPDNDFINVTVTVNEYSLWNVEGIVFVHEESGFEVEDYKISGKVVSFDFYPYELGKWQFQFTVSDENEGYSISYLNFTIYDNTPPFMRIVDPLGPNKEGERIHLSVDNIQDSSEIANVSWRVMGPDGQEMIESGYTMTFKTWTAGSYHVWVTVTDDAGNSAVKETWFDVEGIDDSGGFKMSTPLIVMLILIIVVGGLVLWLSIKDKVPEWFKEKK